jgi:hypothetical protein
MDVIGQFLEDRDDARRETRKDLRAKKDGGQVPDLMLNAWMAEINKSYYSGARSPFWMRDQKAILMALLWPATWLRQRGIELPAQRYGAILVTIMEIIAQHGNTDAVRHFPAYLADCIRKHFIHHGEELYAERKAIRNVIELGMLEGAPVKPRQADVVEPLAQAHRVLAIGKRARKTASEDASQGSLFDL